MSYTQIVWNEKKRVEKETKMAYPKPNQ